MTYLLTVRPFFLDKQEYVYWDERNFIWSFGPSSQSPHTLEKVTEAIHTLTLLYNKKVTFTVMPFTGEIS